MNNIHCLTLCTIAILEVFSGTLWGAGVTIITHGFEVVPGHPVWVDAMAGAIATRAGSGTAVYAMEVTGGGNLPLTVSPMKLVNGSPPNSGGNANGEIVVELFWDAVADALLFPDVNTPAVAAVVVPALLAPHPEMGLSVPVVEMPIHLIGHSRGGSLVCHLAELLDQYGIWVDQVTTLDPHPETLLLSAPDAPANIYDNVFFADNYWQDDGLDLDPNGQMISGSNNRFLPDGIFANGGYADISAAHSDVHLWYYGTIDLRTPTSNGEADFTATMRQTWYTPDEALGAMTGYYFSHVVNGQRLQTGLGLYAGSAFRTPVSKNTDPGSQWPNIGGLVILDPRFALDQPQFTVGETIPVEYFYQNINGVANVFLYLDSDQNPFNTNAVYLTGFSHSATGANIPSHSFPWNTQGLQPGTYHLYAKIDNGFHSRYAYLPKTVQLLLATQPTQFVLTVNPFPSSGGSVLVSPPLGGASGYSAGSMITLTANSSPGYTFTAWGGDASGSSNPLTFAINQNMFVVANFNALPPQSNPSIVVTAPINNSVISSSGVQFSGTASPTTITKVTFSNQTTGASGTALGTTSWSAGVAVSPGNNVVVFTAVDASGASARTTVAVNYNTNTLDTGWDSSSQQTFVASGQPDKNFGAGNNSIVVGNGVPPASNNGNERGLIQFASPAVLPGSTIVSATLELTTAKSFPSDAQPVSVTCYPNTNAWSQNAITWNNAPGYISSSGAQVTVSSVAGATYDIDVTAVVNSRVNGAATNNGFTLVSGAEGAGSENERTLGANPLLDVKYIPGPPSILITNPVANPANAAAAMVPVAGRAVDSTGLTGVTWLNVTSGQTGSAAGGIGGQGTTTAWSATVPLMAGTNNLIFIAHGLSGNTGSGSLVVVYNPIPSVPTNLVATVTGTNEVDVSWSGSTAGPIGLKGYLVYRDGAFLTNTVSPAFQDFFLDLPPSFSDFYTVVAVDNAGNQSAQSPPIHPAWPAPAPAFAQEPQSVTVNTGTNVIFCASLQSFGGLAAFQWLKDGATLQDSDHVVGANTPCLSIMNVQTNDAGEYSVTVTNTTGGSGTLLTSSNALLTVLAPAQACIIPPTGLVGWWSGDGNADDIAGTNNGTLGGAASFTLGEVGQAFALDGNSSYVTVPDSATLDPQQITIEGWFYLTKSGSNAPCGEYILASKYSDLTGWILRFGGSIAGGPQGVAFSVHGSGTATNALSNVPLQLNSWVHLAGTYDGATAHIFVNGQEQGSAVFPGYAPSPVAMVLGASSWTGPTCFMPGLIDEFSIYSRALSQSEIQSIYQAGSAGKCKDTPFINDQPKDVTAILGVDATLTVVAGGPGPLTYQWQFHGTPLPGATNASLILSNVQPAQAGSYDVVVSNSVGSVTSSNAVLTVRALPAIGWPMATNITYGTALSSEQLNAVATFQGTNVPGTFVYSPPLGTVLPAGNGQTLSVTFIPTALLNYQSATATMLINVLLAPLTINGISAVNKVYDGTTNAVLTGAPALTGVIGSDTVTPSGTPTGSFADKDVGSGKPVTIIGLSLSGANAGNYTLNLPTLTGSITQAVLSVTANNATRLVGTTNPPFTGTIAGIQTGDDITAAYSCTATINSPAGTYPIVPSLIDPDGNLRDYSVTIINGTLTVTSGQATMSNPRIIANIFSVTIQSHAGISYTLESVDNLSAPNWQSVQSMTGTGGAITLSDPTASATTRFYRVKAQ